MIVCHMRFRFSSIHLGYLQIEDNCISRWFIKIIVSYTVYCVITAWKQNGHMKHRTPGVHEYWYITSVSKNVRTFKISNGIFYSFSSYYYYYSMLKMRTTYYLSFLYLVLSVFELFERKALFYILKNFEKKS